MSGAAARASSRVKVMLCAPADTIEGGIVAVVEGLTAGMAGLPEVDVQRFLYGKYRRNSRALPRLLRELANVPLFVAAVLRRRPDVVHIETSFDRKTLLRDSVFVGLAHACGRRVMIHAHGGVFHRIPMWPRWQRRWARWFLGACDAVVVTSREEHEDLVRIVGPSRTFAVVPNPVVVPVAPAHPRDGDGLRLVYASRFIPAKGLLDAIEAMRHVRAPGVKLLVFGDGELRPEAERLAADPALEGRVEMMGNAGLTHLMGYFRASDVFLFPSYHHEGFPMTFFFAAASGLAIVSTRVRPIPDYCREPDNCLWVEARDPRAIAAAVDRLAADPALRERQRANNQALVEQFEPVAIARRFLELYRRLPTLRAA